MSDDYDDVEPVDFHQFTEPDDDDNPDSQEVIWDVTYRSDGSLLIESLGIGSIIVDRDLDVVR